MKETWSVEKASLSNRSLASLVTGDSVCLCLGGRVFILGSSTALSPSSSPILLRRLAGLPALSQELGHVQCDALSALTPLHHLVPAVLDSACHCDTPRAELSASHSLQ